MRNLIILTLLISTPLLIIGEEKPRNVLEDVAKISATRISNKLLSQNFKINKNIALKKENLLPSK